MSVILKYPSTSPLLTVTMRNSQLGDIFRLFTSMANRRTRAGVLLFASDTGWPIFRTVTYSFTVITATIMDELRTFFKESAGQEINLQDDLGNHDGIILTPVFDIVEARSVCAYDVSFEFRYIS